MPSTLPSPSNLLHLFFHDWLIHQRDASSHTVHAYRDTWRLFLRLVATRRRRDVAELELSDLTGSEVLAFLDHVERDRHGSIATRNCRLVALRSFFLLVADREPLAAAQCADWPETAALLRALLKRQPRAAHEPLFANRYGQPLQASGVRFRLRDYVAAAAMRHPRLKEKHVTPHTFRHTAAVHLVAAGVDVTVIRSWLGHVHLDTTYLYAQTSVETKRKAIERVDGDARPGPPPRWKRDPALSLGWTRCEPRTRRGPLCYCALRVRPTSAFVRSLWRRIVPSRALGFSPGRLAVCPGRPRQCADRFGGEAD